MSVGQGHRKFFNKRQNLKVVFGLVNQTKLSTVDSFCYSCTVLNSMTSLICFKLQELKTVRFKLITTLARHSGNDS